MRTVTKALAGIGLAAALTMGLGACHQDNTPDETTDAVQHPECEQGRPENGTNDLGERLGLAVATPLPEPGQGLTANSPESDFVDAKYDDNTYVIGWTPPGTGDRVDVDKLEDARIIYWEGATTGPCTVIDLSTARSKGATQTKEVFTAVTGAGVDVPHDARRAVLSFKHPSDENDTGLDYVNVDLWNIKKGQDRPTPNAIPWMKELRDDFPS